MSKQKDYTYTESDLNTDYFLALKEVAQLSLDELEYEESITLPDDLDREQPLSFSL